MNPQRRKILATLVMSLAVAPAIAQRKAVPQAGTEYQVLAQPLPLESATKVEVIEFFWYGCPHCFAFEPVLAPWTKKLPGSVLFNRVPAVFNETWEPHAKLYYALEILGEAERLHKVIFDAIHRDHKQLATEASIGEFLELHGIPRRKFTDTYNSFSVNSKILRSKQLQSAYKIDGVPAMGVDGRYWTSATLLGGSHAAVLPVVEYLIGEARKYHKLPKA